jgi:hypothetical protein
MWPLPDAGAGRGAGSLITRCVLNAKQATMRLKNASRRCRKPSKGLRGFSSLSAKLIGKTTAEFVPTRASMDFQRQRRSGYICI